MDINTKSKWQVRLAAVLIFVLGLTAGALALNGYQKWSGTRAAGDRHQRWERMLDRLQLTTDQRTQVQQILTETREQLQALRKESEPRFQTIRQQADERLQKILTPEQWKQFQQERDAMRSRGGRRGRSEKPEGSRQ